MKTYAVKVTLHWKALSGQDAMDECDQMLVNLENIVDSPGYQGYRDMTVEEVPGEVDTPARRD